MTRKAPAKKPTKASESKSTQKLAKPKVTTVYTAVRPVPSESPVFTEPDRAFATKAAARAHADALNRELRGLLNPFDGCDPEDLITGGEKVLNALVKKFRLPAPKKTKAYHHPYIDWEAWWDRHYFDMTDAQREAVWDVLDKFDWYTVKATALE